MSRPRKNKKFIDPRYFMDEKMEVLSEATTAQRQRDSRAVSLGDIKEVVLDQYIMAKYKLDQGDFSRAHPEKWRELGYALPDVYDAMDQNMSDKDFQQAILTVLRNTLP